MKTFSLRSVLLFVTIAALVLSHIRMSYRLREVNQELDVVRRNYGYMKIVDNKKINVISLAVDRGDSEDALRFVVPPGQRYFLHLSETTAENNSQLPNGTPKTTVCLNTWKDGEDVILRYNLYNDAFKHTPFLRVASQNQGFFTYEPDDWPTRVAFLPASQLKANEKIEIPINEPIVLLRAISERIDRGIVLWLESETHYNARNKQ